MRLTTLCLALFLASGASAQSLVGLTNCCPNEVVTVDPAVGDTTTVASIGTAQDAFIATVGSLVIDSDGGRAFLIRNGRVAEVDVATGAVTEGPEASDWTQLAGFDAARGRLYAFATQRDTLDTAENWIIRNYLVAYDPIAQDTARLAQIGTYTFINGEGTGDVFASVTGPAVASASTLYTIRNGRLVTVDLASGAIAEGTANLTLPEVSGVDADWLYWTSREVSGPDSLRTFTGRLLRQPASGGPDATPDTVGVYALATVDSTGAIDGDTYAASFGVAFYDEAGDRVLLHRNSRLVEVPLASLTARDIGPAGRIRYVPGASGLSTASEPAPEADLRLAVSPNPASGAVTVSLVSPEAVTVEVVDALGRRVALLHDGPLAAESLTWETAVAPGVYLVRATTRSGVQTVPVTIVR